MKTTTKLATDGHQVDYRLTMGDETNEMSIVADDGFLTITMDHEIVQACPVTAWIGEIAALVNDDTGMEILEINSANGSSLLVSRSGRRGEYAYLEYRPHTGDNCTDSVRLGTWFCNLLGIDD